MTRHIDRRALFASGAAAALLAATGVSAGPQPRRGGRLRLALSGATRSDGFDARLRQGLFMQVAMPGMVFDTLTQIGADGTLRGELATGWRGTADARIWELDLRPDVLFHNGAAFTAGDVVASLALHRNTSLAAIERIEAIDPVRVRIALAAPDADFPYRLSAPQLVIYPADSMPQAMAEGIGTGLYRLHRFLPGRQVIGERVETHYKDGEAGWFDSVELVSIPADEVRAEALREGFVDAADLSAGHGLDGMARIALLPDARNLTAAVHTDVQMPSTVGMHAPLDNLRAAERWWMG
ncbi:ABC transporter substrate-binding protein [Roseobacter sinensis]|uniref:ABC transporter substrate-binding protein n=1 Tax=Roseobacter sinensis TaxID=2931391 RepID=A0ABT3B912_9RHOB|nr:ABC transporter substrate-binding protein [Roseobacter sp. WL0113]MCV3270050.1 ABC transporter substrate-binding protein [Roseobacter sp. WL0113]